MARGYDDGPIMTHTLLTRRRMCGVLALTPAALHLTTSGAAEAQTSFSLRYCLPSSVFGCTPIEEILPVVRQTGAEGIDLWTKPHADQREQVDAMGPERFAELLRKHDARVGMTTRYDLGPFGLSGEFAFLSQFGARVVVTGSSGPPDLSGAGCKAAIGNFIEKMKPHVAQAEKHGVTIAIENHAKALVSTPDSLRYLAEMSDSPNLGIAFAPYHLPQDERVLASLIADLGPKLVHFYAWQYGKGAQKKLPREEQMEQLPGRGKLDFRPVLAALKKIGYSRYVEIFMHPVPRGVPILDTTAQIAGEINRVRDYLNRCLSKS